MAKIALIRVLTCEREEDLNLHGRIIERVFSELSVDSYCIPDQPRGIHDKRSQEEALPKIVSLGRDVSPEYEGIIISCAGDPGMESLSERVDIPVVGAGAALRSIVGYYGKKAGVIGITEDLPENFRKILKDKEIHYIRPEGISTTNHIGSNKEEIIGAAKELEGQGCCFITFACTGYSAAQAAIFLKEHITIPIVDIIMAEGMVMNNLMMMKNIGRG